MTKKVKENEATAELDEVQTPVEEGTPVEETKPEPTPTALFGVVLTIGIDGKLQIQDLQSFFGPEAVANPITDPQFSELIHSLHKQLEIQELTAAIRRELAAKLV